MTPGPILVYRCPDTNKPIFAGSTGSGNTFGATFWTDGFMDAPMLPEELPFLLSPHSGKLLWISDLVLLKEEHFFYENRSMEEIEKAHPGAKWAEEEALMDPVLYHLETHKNLTLKREEILRLYAWHRSNDPVRQDPPGEPLRTPGILANMEKLEELLAPVNKADARLLRAELLRELARFEESLAVLTLVRSSSRKAARDAIRALAQRKETIVARL